MVSLSIIVKNEERHLPDCLNSIKDVVDEIVLVDTGSTDETVKIAEQFGAKVFHYEWNNDFASARNYALSKCSGDWILYLDADERLNNNSADELRKLTSSKTKTGFYCRIYNVDEISNRPSVMSYVRLFALNPTIKFEGRVHEQIENSLFKNGYELKNSGIEITHIGYNLTNAELKKKAERNYNILKSEYAENQNGYTAFQLGQTLHKLEREEEAVNHFQLALKDNSLRKEYKATACRSIAIYYADNSDLINADKFINESVKYDPQQPLSLLSHAKIKMKTGRFSEAINSIKQALETNSDYINGIKVSSQNILIEQKVIVYNGLLISLVSNDIGNINFFLEELKKESNANEYEFYCGLIKGNRIPSHGNSINDIINLESLELLFVSLNRINDKKDVLTFMEEIEKYFGQNSFYCNKYGLFLFENSIFDKAEQVLKRSLEINPLEYSSVFYLISVYIKQNRISDVMDTINEHRHTFSANSQIAEKIKVIEQKISSLL